MSAAVGRVVYAHYDLSRKHVLNAEIPLVDLRVTSRAGVQVAGVAEASLRQVAILRSLWWRQTRHPRCRGWKWAITAGCLDGGRSKTRKLVREIVFGEKHGGGLRKCRSGILEIGGDVHSVEHSRAA